MVFVAGRKRMQLPNYRKVTSHLVVQVMHKVFMYLIQFPSDFLSRLFLPTLLKETPSIYSYSIALICDLALSSSPSTSYVLVNMHSQFRFHRMNYGDRKSTRLNSSHGYISYAVFCLKKKK